MNGPVRKVILMHRMGANVSLSETPGVSLKANNIYLPRGALSFFKKKKSLSRPANEQEVKKRTFIFFKTAGKRRVAKDSM